MITIEEAQKIALQHLNEAYDVEGDELIIETEHTKELDLGYMFSYDSKRFVETFDFAFAIAGNGPILVFRDNGEVHRFGSVDPIDDLLDKMRRSRS